MKSEPDFDPCFAKKNDMQKHILRYGIYAGLLVAAQLLITTILYKNDPAFEGSMWIGFGSMILAFGFIYVAISNFRKEQPNQAVGFGQAFAIGLGVSAVASLLYLATWAIEYNFVFPDFMDRYTETMMAKAKAAHASPEELKEKMAQMDSYKKQYKNPLMFSLLTLMEIFPVGLILSLIFAGVMFTRKAQARTGEAA